MTGRSRSRAGATETELRPGLCILLVEDDEADAYLIHRALSYHPAVGSIVQARDGVEALAMVKRHALAPDLAFIDLRMPRMDGLALLAAFADDADLAFPMVVLTSSAAPADVVRSQACGAVRVLVKPETIRQMHELLKGSVDSAWSTSLAADPVQTGARAQAQMTARDTARADAALRSAASLARIGGWEVDFVTRRASLSPELCDLLDTQQADMSIEEAITYWVEEDRPGFRVAMERAAEHGDRLVFEGRSLATDGSFRSWRLLGESVLVNGFCVALRGVAQDITEWSDIIDREAVAVRSAQAISGFLAAMSHELHTPLNGVLGMAQAMGLDELSGPQRDRLGLIQTSGEALLQLLNDLLDFSMMEAGKIELEDGIVATRALAETARTVFEPLAQAKGIDLTVVLDHSADGSWRGDPDRVRQLLHNLISNAVKFSDDGAISVTISLADTGLEFRISDTGIGISAGRLPHVFERFVQADPSITRRFGGPGLGLAISRDLARLMGGDIRVESREGHGSTFVASLPLEPPSAATPPASPDLVPPAPAPTPRLRVLAAEDNQANQQVLTALLQAVGIEPVITSNGQEAVDLWRGGDWDVVLMDIQMPVMDGMAATSLIRAEEEREGRSRTPIIAVTANAMAHQQDQYLALGMDDVVAKPINLTALLQAMSCAVDSGTSDRTPRPVAGSCSAP